MRLILALTHAGIATEGGLKVIADVWRDFVPEPDTRWQEVARRNRQTLRALEEQDLTTCDFVAPDPRIILDEWTFPLHHEDLSMIPVDVEELRERQRNWSPDGYYGPFDY